MNTKPCWEPATTLRIGSGPTCSSGWRRKAELNCGDCEGCVERSVRALLGRKFRATYLTHMLRAGIDRRTRDVVSRVQRHGDLDGAIVSRRTAEDA